MKNVVIIILVLLLVAAGGILMVQQQGQNKLRRENESLLQQSNQLAALRADNEQLSNRLAEATSGAEAQTMELLKLRAEAATLRKQAAQIADLQSKNQQLNTALADNRKALLEKAQAASTAKRVDLGAVRLINQRPNLFDLGGGRRCTLTPTINSDGNYNIKVVFQGPKADGSIESTTAEIATSPGRAVALEAGGYSIAFTPTVNP